jgi:hypothetical protein
VARKARESAGALAAAAAVKEAERKAAERKKKRGKAKKYYAVAVGRSHGIFTDWDEVEGYVNGFSGCIFKAFKSHHEVKSWYTHQEAAPPPPIPPAKRSIRRRHEQRRKPWL